MKYALVTGACGGLGKAVVKRLTQEGWYVYAADIDPSVKSLFADNSLSTGIIMDSVDQVSIRKAFDLVSSKNTGLDALIHLAGLLVVGSVAEVPAEKVQKVLDVNLMGVYNVNREFLPLIMEHKGRIIIVTSETAVQTAAPFNGIYSMSKYALEAYADALRRELAFLGIRVVKIRPGPFKSKMTRSTEARFVEAVEHSQYFKKNLSSGMPYLKKVYSKAHDPAIMAGTVLKALTVSRPRIVYSLRHDLLRSLIEFFPVRWTDRLIQRMLS